MGRLENIGLTPKRKAIMAIPTRCRYCYKNFIDKYFDEPVHRVLCPHCNRVNAVVDAETRDKTFKEYALRMDLKQSGRLGFHASEKQRSEFMKKELEKSKLRKKTSEEEVRGRKVA